MKEGWLEKEIGDIALVIAGQSPKGIFYNDKGLGVPFYQGKKEFTDKFIGEPTKWTTSVTKEAVEGDILMSVRAPVGPVNFATQNICIGRGLAAIRSKEELNKDYLFNFLQFQESQLIGSSGAVFNSINKSQISKIKIPVPPLEVQQQIVQILDQAFEKIDRAIANIEQNIKNAEESFQAKLNEVFSQKGDGWEEDKLGDICYVLNGYAFKSKEAIEKSSTQLLRMGNLYKNVLDLNRKPVFYPDSFGVVYKEYLLKEGDLIMSLTGTVDKTDYGYTVKVPPSKVNLLLNQRIMKIEINDSNVLIKDYLKNYLLSPDFLKRLYATASGTRQANLSSKKILDLKIFYPSKIEEQLEIVENLKNLRNCSNLLRKQYSKKIENLNNLKKSLLEKAFKGELTKEVETV